MFEANLYLIKIQRRPLKDDVTISGGWRHWDEFSITLPTFDMALIQ